MKYPLTEETKAAAKKLVEVWNAGKLKQRPYKITGPEASLTELSVRGVLEKDGYPPASVLRELEKFNLVEIVTERGPDRITYIGILLLEELRYAVENDFEVSEFYQQGGVKMARCSLSDRQKDLLRSIAPGLKDGTVDTEWSIFTGDDRIIAIMGLDRDGKLWQEMWEDKVRFSDFAAFERCGFFQQAGKDRFILFEQAIIDAVERNFQEETEASTLVSGNQYNISGDFSQSNINIGSLLNNVSQSIVTGPHGDEVSRQELAKLIDQLNAALQEIPSGYDEELEAVTSSTEEIARELNKEKVNKIRLKISGEGLVKAAEHLSGIVPKVLVLATQISNFVAQFPI
jgi:hypothetical protein